MTNKFLFTLSVLTSLLCLQSVWAHEKPRLFGVQKDAIDVLLSPDGKLMFASDGTGSGTVWDVATRKPLWKTVNGIGLQFSRDARIVVLVPGLNDFSPRTRPKPFEFDELDGRTGRFLRSFSDATIRALEDYNPLGLVDTLYDSSFSSNNRDFLVASSHSLRRFDLKSGHLISTLKWHTPANQTVQLPSLRLAPDGKTVVGATLSQTAGIFDVRTAQRVRALPTLIGSVIEVFSDNSLLVTATKSAADLDIVRAADGRKLWSVPSYLANFTQISPEARRIYTLAKDGLQVRDAHTGRLLKLLAGPRNNNFAPSPDGNYLYEARGGKIWKWRAR